MRIECGKEFIFEAWEQEVYKTKNKLDYGKYCLTCRVKNGCNLTDECNNVRECLDYRLPRIFTVNDYFEMIVR